LEPAGHFETHQIDDSMANESFSLFLLIAKGLPRMTQRRGRLSTTVEDMSKWFQNPPNHQFDSQGVVDSPRVARGKLSRVHAEKGMPILSMECLFWSMANHSAVGLWWFMLRNMFWNPMKSWTPCSQVNDAPVWGCGKLSSVNAKKGLPKLIRKCLFWLNDGHSTASIWWFMLMRLAPSGAQSAWNSSWTWWTGLAFQGLVIQRSVAKRLVERTVKHQPHPATTTITVTKATACTRPMIEMKKDCCDRWPGGTFVLFCWRAWLEDKFDSNRWCDAGNNNNDNDNDNDNHEVIASKEESGILWWTASMNNHGVALDFSIRLHQNED
jgi:hypothetical protein